MKVIMRHVVRIEQISEFRINDQTDLIEEFHPAGPRQSQKFQKLGEVLPFSADGRSKALESMQAALNRKVKKVAVQWSPGARYTENIPLSYMIIHYLDHVTEQF